MAYRRGVKQHLWDILFLYPDARPRIISDNGPQFIANDFTSFIRLSGMTHVPASPYYLQNNGKIERYHKSLKSERIRPKTPLSLEDAKRLVGQPCVGGQVQKPYGRVSKSHPEDEGQ